MYQFLTYLYCNKLLLLGISGKVMKRIEDEGFIITGLRMLHFNKKQAEEFLEVYKGVVPEYSVSHNSLILNFPLEKLGFFLTFNSPWLVDYENIIC